MKARVEINGRGGELVLHRLTQEAFDFWESQSEELLTDYVLDNRECAGVPDFAKFASGSDDQSLEWYELDSLGHYYGPHPSFSDLLIAIDSGSGFKEVLSDDFKRGVAKAKSKLLNKSVMNHFSQREPAVQIYSVEKGCLFEAEFDFDNKRDFRDLVFNASVFFDETLITSVYFKDVALDNLGGDTTGKGIFVKLVRV